MNGLFGSAVLEVAIGLIFVYLLLSLMCTALNEWLISLVLKLRQKTLRRTLDVLLSNQPTGDGDFVSAFNRHPLISKTNASAGKHGASYLSASAFSATMIDLVATKKEGVVDFPKFAAGLHAMPEGELKQALAALTAHASNDLEKVRANIEQWFDDSMDRATGVFKRRAQIWAFVVAAVLTVGTNADTLDISKRLWHNSALRAEVVNLAEKRAAMPRPTLIVEYKDPDDPLTPTITEAPQNAVTGDENQMLGQLLGWNGVDAQGLLMRIPGWILTAIAVSLGAPFWFDVLNKFVNLRNAGKVPEKKEQAA